MNVFNHLLPNSDVVGIGPLLMEDHPDVEQRLVYGTKRQWFELHRSSCSLKVYSRWFEIKESEDEREAMIEWRGQYSALRTRIASQLNELPDQRTFHVDDVGEAYDALKNELDLLLANLVPAADTMEPVQELIADVYNAIRNLRDLACKNYQI